MASIKNIHQQAYEAYEQYGVQGAIDVANKYNIKTYAHCKWCNCQAPVLNNDCLICGQTIDTNKKGKLK